MFEIVHSTFEISLQKREREKMHDACMPRTVHYIPHAFTLIVSQKAAIAIDHAPR